MDSRELLLLAFVAAVVRGALFAQPPNVTIDEESCRLQVRWLPAEPPNSNCIPIYEVILRVNGSWDDLSKQSLETTSCTMSVPLGKEIDFKIKTSCQKPYEDLSHWNGDETFHVVQNGTPGTGARDLNCTWWNRKHMECSWSAGEKASPDTSYKLFYWYHSLDKGRQCRNVTREGSGFQCSFELEVGHVSLITVSVLGDSGNIQASCFFFESINSLVKCDPPVITNVLQNGSEVFLSWSQPCNLNNMDYEVEVDSKPRPFKDTVSATIPVEPDVRHTFRVRLKTEVGQWSAWSKMVVLDGRTSIFPFILFILIPSCVALLLVILLIYLKRIKLVILPKIPDPEKILKHMFEEQNENQPTHETANNEETHSLTIVEPAGNEK